MRASFCIGALLVLSSASCSSASPPPGSSPTPAPSPGEPAAQPAPPVGAAVTPATPAADGAHDLTAEYLETIAQNPSAHAGKHVRGCGIIHVGTTLFEPGPLSQLTMSLGGKACTRMMCAPGSCCNRCSAGVSLSVADVPIGFSLEGSDLGCKGDDCQLTCKPAEGATVAVEGTLRVVEQGPKVQLVIDVAQIGPCQGM